jgi:enoyl-CoA hydratase/carnithine racemase
MSDLVAVTTTANVRTIAIDRPARLNALDAATMEALGRALAAANADDGVGAVILTGTGDRAFSAGKDLEDPTDPDDPEASRREVEILQDLTRRIVGSPKIYIAAVNGWAVGGGFELALNCDLSVWAESATAFMPELKWGLYPSGASTMSIARRAGSYAALAMLLLEERIGARRLQELGLAWRVVPDGKALAEAEAVARRILTLPAARVADFKAAVNRSLYGDVEAVLQDETAALLSAMADPETAARVAAFSKQKRA